MTLNVLFYLLELVTDDGKVTGAVICCPPRCLVDDADGSVVVLKPAGVFLTGI